MSESSLNHIDLKTTRMIDGCISGYDKVPCPFKAKKKIIMGVEK